MFLFQLLKYFEGKHEYIGALVVPGVVLTLLAAMPILGRWKLGHRFNVAFLLLLVGGAGVLTALAKWDDHYGPRAAEFQAAVAESEQDAHRAAQLAAGGIGPEGAIALARAIRRFRGGSYSPPVVRSATTPDRPQRSLNKPAIEKPVAAKPEADKPAGEMPAADMTPTGAPRLAGFASREWLAGLLDPEQVAGPNYFGNTAHRDGDMVRFVREDLKQWKPEEVEAVVAALSAQAQLPAQTELDTRDRDKIAAGIKLIKDEDRCSQCHKFEDAGSLGSAPELTGYGSRAWLTGFISNPTAENYYGDHNDRMPAFASQPAGSPQNLLSAEALSMLVDWLRRDTDGHKTFCDGTC